MDPLPYPYLVIEGNIGAGKTTLTTLLAERFGSRLILEEFADNPFLPRFYKNPERYAFPLELFFLTARYKQLQQELPAPELFDRQIVADYFFQKTLLFARNNLDPEEYRLFQRLFQILNAANPRPSLLVYLYRPIEELLLLIRRRNRVFEQQIAPGYLQKIQATYFNFFRTPPNFPILVLELRNLELTGQPQHFERFIELLRRPYGTGVHQLRLWGS